MDVMPSNTFFFFAVIYLPSESVCMRVYSVSVCSAFSDMPVKPPCIQETEVEL